MGSNRNYSIIIKPKCTPHVQAHIVIADNRLGHLLGVPENLNESRNLLMVCRHVINVIPHRASIGPIQGSQVPLCAPEAMPLLLLRA